MKRVATAILIASATLFGAVEKGPYLLYEGSNTEMTVLYQMSSSQSGTISWGTTTNYELGSSATQSFGSDNQYRYTISGLTPGTLYYYNIEGVGKGSFRTAPEQSENAVKLFAFGDTRSYPADHNSVANQILTQIKSDKERQTMALFSGDYVSDGGDERDWTEQFFPRSKSGIVEMQSKLPIVGAIGNHEAERTGGSALLRKYYPFPHEASSNFYWSFDYGPVHVTFVDQYTASYRTGSAQYNWIKSDLASTDKEWKIMVFHGPGYSASGHENDKDVQNYLQPLCEQYGVDLVLNGDNHYYSRADVNGVMHITTGGGGAPLYDPNKSYPNIVKVDKSNHFCEIDIVDNKCVFTARRASGGVIETFTLEHAPSTPTIKIAEPSVDTMILMKDSVEVLASVNSQGLSVEKVEFLVDGAVVNSDLSEPYSFRWASETPDTVSITLRAIIDGVEYLTEKREIAVVDPADQEFTLTIPIRQSSDDAEEDEGDALGDVRIASPDLEFTEDLYNGTTYKQLVGLRFDRVELPNNYKITSAKISFTAAEAQSKSTQLTIHGEAADNSVTFVEQKNNILNRPTTNAKVSWNPEAWSAEQAGVAQTTGDVTEVIKEIITRPGWKSGNPVTFIVTGSGQRIAHSYDGAADKAPVLTIKYKIDTNGDPVIDKTPADTTIQEGKPYSFELTVTDPDANDTHVWSLVIDGAPKLSFDGSYEWTPTVDNIGENIFEAWVEDGSGASDSVSWIVTVEKAVAIIDGAVQQVEADFLIYPNPVIRSESKECRFYIGVDAVETYETAAITLYSALGEVLYRTGDIPLYSGITSGGNIELASWDLTQSSGRFVGGGSYLAVVKCKTRDGEIHVSRFMTGVRE